MSDRPNNATLDDDPTLAHALDPAHEPTPVSPLHSLNERELVEHIAISSARTAHQLQALLAGGRRASRKAWDPVNGPPWVRYADGRAFEGVTIFNDGASDCYVGQSNANLNATNALIVVRAGSWFTLPVVASSIFLTGPAAGSALVVAYDHAPEPAAGLISGITGTVASGSTDDGSNPVKVGGVYHATPATLVDGQRGELLLDLRENLKVSLVGGNSTSLVAAAAPGDGVSSQGALYANAQALLYNGSTWDRQRTPSVFKSVQSIAITAGTPATIWTPAAGKKFRLMGYALGVSATINVLFKDNGTVEFARTGVFANGGIAASPPMGNGYLSLAANNVLALDVSAGTVTVSGFVFGTEE